MTTTKMTKIDLLADCMDVNGIDITSETIMATRNHFIDISKRCISDAKSGEVRVNDLDKYVEWQERSIERTKQGDNDHTLTFLQHALWLQTGECVAILP